MKPRVLFVITTDPRTSPRPAEAIRIAAGVGALKKVELSVYLRGPAVLALSENTDCLIDGEHFGRYLPLLNQPIYVEADSHLLHELGDTTLEAKPIPNEAFAALAAQQTYLLRF